MRSFGDRPLKQKLMLIIVGTTFTVLTMASAIWLVNDWKAFNQEVRSNLQGLSGVIANNVRASVSFGDKDDAHRTLSALTATPEILEAVVYSANGEQFSGYFRQGLSPSASFPQAPKQLLQHASNDLEWLEPIVLENEVIGYVYLRNDSEKLRQRVLLGFALEGGILFLTLIISLALSSRLQRIVTRPIQHLLSTMLTVSKDQNFAIRAQKEHSDEVGRLVDGFNEMLAQLEDRERHLTRYREHLEDEVESRTAELQEANRAFQESEKKMRAIVSSAADAILTFDEDGNILSFNTAAEKLFGFSAEEMVGNSFSRLTASQKRSRPYLSLTEHLMTRAAESPIIGREFVGQTKSGEAFPSELSLTKVEVNDRGIFICILRDITQRKAAEAQLIRSKEAAEALSKAKTQFLANMSHEIRTPMNGIFGTIQLTLKTGLDPYQRELVEMMKTSADALLRIVNDVLDFSKADAGKLVLLKEEFPLRTTLDKILGGFFIKAREQDVALTVSLAPDVPDKLTGDSQRLGQVLMNLVGNALRFTPAGGSVEVRVERRSRIEGECELLFCVSDTGIGIPEDKQQSIFEAFTQADTSSTRQYGGTGLGLAIASSLVKLMHGDIWVTSSVGAGSKFFFSARFALPIREREATEKTSPTIAVPQGVMIPASAEIEVDSEDVIRGKTALLVEDNPMNRFIGKSFLERMGVKVTMAEHGQQALDILEEAKFDIILMDCQMPVLDGFATTSAIRKKDEVLGCRSRIIAMTAHAMAGDRERCLEAGMDDYVSKPINEQVFKEVLRRNLDGE